MKALILTDGKAGHENQSRALVRGLGMEFDIVRVEFRSKVAKGLSYPLDCLGVRTKALFKRVELPGERYSLVVGTGSGTFYAAKAWAKALGAKSAVVLYPRGYDLESFDLIMAPAFDEPKTRRNIVRIPMNLVANDEAFYEIGVESFLGKHTPGERPAVGVIVGGPNKCSTMSAEWMRGELDRVFAENAGSEMWVTTSRRTPKDVEEVVKGYPWHYQLIYSEDHFNPIPAFVKLAKRLYVTAESTGMLSEACTFGSAEVMALDNLKGGHHKFRKFLEMLTEEGYLSGTRKVNLASRFGRAKTILKCR